MPARKTPRRYYADDLTHTVSKRSWEFDDDKPRLKCDSCGLFNNWHDFLLDTRDKNTFVCPNCYRKMYRNKDWKAWEVGY